MKISGKWATVGLAAVAIFLGIVVGGSGLLKSVTGSTFINVFSSGGTITVDPGIRYQTMNGWETHAQSGEQNPRFDLYKDTLFDRAVEELGINRVRLEVRASSENSQDYWSQWRNGQINDATWRCVRYSTVNDNPNSQDLNPSGFHFSELDFTVTNVVLPLKQRLAARGEKLFLNLEYVAFTGQMQGSACPSGLQYIHDDPDEYAEFMLATTLHLRDTYGLEPDAWEVILEPDNVSHWDGRLIGQAIVATAARLEQQGFTPQFIAPSTASMAAASSYFDGILQTPGAVQYISELAYHRYHDVSGGALNNIVTRAQQHGLGTAMLEHIGADYHELHEDLKVGHNVAWQQFALAYPTSDNGAQYFWINESNPSSPQVVMGSRTRLLRQYFKFIRGGAQRIGAGSADGNFDPVAFINTNGKYVVVVKANGGGSFSVAGLPVGSYGIKYTTHSQYDVDLADVTLGSGEVLNATIPASGVITLYGK